EIIKKTGIKKESDAIEVIKILNCQNQDAEIERIQVYLLYCLQDCEYPDMVPELLNISQNAAKSVKKTILLLLTNIDSKEAVEFFFEILDSFNNEPHDYLSLRRWESKLIQAENIFPRIFDYLEIQNLFYNILLITLTYLQNNKINSNVVSDKHVDFIINYVKQSEQKNADLHLDTSKFNWFYEDEYNQFRCDLALILDLLGYLNHENKPFKQILLNYLDSKDPKLVFFAIKSLLTKSSKVDEKYFEFVAQDNEMRLWLFELLEEQNKLSLFPEKYKVQDELAKSAMVNWLIFPTELGTAPDEIILENVFKFETKESIIEYFLFKFKTNPPHWAAEDGWMAGVSGPFNKNNYPTTKPRTGTFSSFDSWEQFTPEEHLKKIVDVLDDWAKKL
ncbi:MAG: hypothetical protein LBK82_13310, partial [Planctomycetaceae bacterium]|nr:hypothetical protein [Planctomycetaceae bacterium]